MTDNIWHDSIDSNFTEIAGLVDNPKTIVKHNFDGDWKDSLMKCGEKK